MLVVTKWRGLARATVIAVTGEVQSVHTCWGLLGEQRIWARDIRVRRVCGYMLSRVQQKGFKGVAPRPSGKWITLSEGGTEFRLPTRSIAVRNVDVPAAEAQEGRPSEARKVVASYLQADAVWGITKHWKARV